MPFVLLTVALQVIAVVHLFRTGRNMTWLFLIVLVPMVGVLAYFIIEVLPSLSQNPAARKALRRAQQAIDPNRGLREGSLNYERSQNIESAARLAGELDEGRPLRRRDPHLHRSAHGAVRRRPEDLAGAWRSTIRGQRSCRCDRDTRLSTRQESRLPLGRRPSRLCARARRKRRDARALEEYTALVQLLPGRRGARPPSHPLQEARRQGARERAVRGSARRTLDSRRSTSSAASASGSSSRNARRRLTASVTFFCAYSRVSGTATRAPRR